MILLLNLIFAWITVIFTVFLSIIYILRILEKHKICTSKLIKNTNRYLRKKHILLGHLIIVTALIHGILSSYKLLSINYGTFSFIICNILCFSNKLKTKFKHYWITIHRILTIIFIVLILLHITEVGGIKIIEYIIS